MNETKLKTLLGDLNSVNHDVNMTLNMHKDCKINHGEVLRKILQQQKDIIYSFQNLLSELGSNGTQPKVVVHPKTKEVFYDCGKCNNEIEEEQESCKECGEDIIW